VNDDIFKCVRTFRSRWQSRKLIQSMVSTTRRRATRQSQLEA
jgi:hypothetical protein